MILSSNYHTTQRNNGEMALKVLEKKNNCSQICFIVEILLYPTKSFDCLIFRYVWVLLNKEFLKNMLKEICTECGDFPRVIAIAFFYFSWIFLNLKSNFIIEKLKEVGIESFYTKLTGQSQISQEKCLLNGGQVFSYTCLSFSLSPRLIRATDHWNW